MRRAQTMPPTAFPNRAPLFRCLNEFSWQPAVNTSIQNWKTKSNKIYYSYKKNAVFSCACLCFSLYHLRKVCVLFSHLSMKLNVLLFIFVPVSIEPKYLMSFLLLDCEMLIVTIRDADSQYVTWLSSIKFHTCVKRFMSE